MLSLFPIATILRWVGLAFVVCLFLAAWVVRHDPAEWDLFYLLRTATSLLSAFTVAFGLIATVGWRWAWGGIPALRNLYPDLNGTWDVSITWNRAGQHGAVSAKAVIKQTLFRISMEVEAPDSVSRTLSAVPKKDPESGRAALHYIYLVTPHSRPGKASVSYYGAAILAVSDDNSVSVAGNYWTSHQSDGRLILKRCR